MALGHLPVALGRLTGALVTAQILWGYFSGNRVTFNVASDQLWRRSARVNCEVIESKRYQSDEQR